MTYLLNEAVAAIQNGDTKRGRELLVRVVQEEPRNELAWMWMTTVVETPKERRFCLVKILEINPGNVRAREQLAELDEPAPSVPPVAPAPPAPRAAPAPPAPRAAPAPPAPRAAPVPPVPRAASVPPVPGTAPVPPVPGAAAVPPVPGAAPVPPVPGTAAAPPPAPAAAAVPPAIPPHGRAAERPRAVVVPESQAFRKSAAPDIGGLIRGPLGLWAVIILIAAGAAYFVFRPGPEERFQTPVTSSAAASEEPSPSQQAKAATARNEKVKKAGGEVETKTPGLIVDSIVAGGGSYLVLRIEAMPSLTIYDADSQELVRTLRLGTTNFLYTAGGQTALVYYPDTNQFQSWNLESGQKMKSKLNSKGAIVTCMTMGHSNGGLAWIRYAEGTSALDRAGSYLLDTTSLKALEGYEGKANAYGHNGSYRDAVHQRADGRLSLISEWASSHSPSGLGLFILSPGGWEHRYQHDSVGDIAVGDDGLLYTQTGVIYNTQLTKVAAVSGMKLVPALGGRFFIGVADNGSMQVYSSGSTSPIATAGAYPGVKDNRSEFSRTGFRGGGFTLDRHITFDPKRSRILVVPLTHDKVIYRYFDLKSTLDSLGMDYLVVLSSPETNLRAGETWTYELEVMTNAKNYEVSLTSAPEGMEIQKDRKLVWRPHPNYQGTEHVVVLIQASNGESTYHSFDLTVKKVVKPRATV